MTIEMWPLGRIVPYAKNARKIPQRAIDKVAASLREFGWQQPIVVDTAGVIVVGHTRLLAARQLGWTEAPVLVADKLTPTQIAAYRLMDNRSHEESGWNLELLGPELIDLKAMNFDLSLTGFELRELRKLVPEKHDEPPAEMDKAEELQRKWKVERGQVWEIDEHRLMCGDSTNGADVALLMNGALARLVFADPPYGVGFERGKFVGRDKAAKSGIFSPIVNDDLRGSSLALFIARALTCAREVADEASVYCWSPPLHEGFAILEGIGRAGWKVQSQIIWRKTPFVIGRADYHWQHEVCWYGFMEKHRWFGGRDKSTVWDVPKAQLMDSHPTMKPVLLPSIALSNSSEIGEITLDPFIGAGSTMVAAQNLNRRCYGLEIEPKYCAVILERMTAMGLTPVCFQPIKEKHAARRSKQVQAV